LALAQKVAAAASAFKLRRTGHGPKLVAVVLGEEMLVITRHGALPPAERALPQTRQGASQAQEFHVAGTKEADLHVLSMLMLTG
jgi:uncharacterized protein YbcI